MVRRISTLALTALLFAVCSPQARAAGTTCDDGSSVMPAGYVFRGHGATSGNLFLSLSLPLFTHVGEHIVAVVRLQSASVAPITIDADDRPWGREYGLEVRNAADGSVVLMRPGYVDVITTVGSERISKSCGAYQAVSVSGRYDLAPGEYLIRAVRTPRQTYGDTQPYSTRYLPRVVSNEITLTVLPT